MSERRLKGILWSLAILTLWGTLGGAEAPAAEEKEGDKAGGPAQIGAAESCPCTFGPIITDTAVPIEKGKFGIQPQWWFRTVGGSFRSGWHRTSAGGDFFTFFMPWKFTYGPFKNTEVFVVIPYIHNWASSVDNPGGPTSANFGGLGDISLTLKYQFLEETEHRPVVTGFLGVTFPSGHHYPLNPSRLGTDELGQGAYVFTAGFDFFKWVKPFLLYGNLWYSSGTTTMSTVQDARGRFVGVRTRGQDYITLNLAAEYPIGGQGPWVALLEFVSYYDVGGLIGPKSSNPPATLLSVLPGLEYVVNQRLAMALGVLVDVAGKNTNYQYTPIFSVNLIF